MTLPLAHETWFESGHRSLDWGFAGETLTLVLLACAVLVTLAVRLLARVVPRRRHPVPGAAGAVDAVRGAPAPRGLADRAALARRLPVARDGPPGRPGGDPARDQHGGRGHRHGHGLAHARVGVAADRARAAGDDRVRRLPRAPAPRRARARGVRALHRPRALVGRHGARARARAEPRRPGPRRLGAAGRRGAGADRRRVRREAGEHGPRARVPRRGIPHLNVARRARAGLERPAVHPRGGGDRGAVRPAADLRRAAPGRSC